VRLCPDEWWVAMGISLVDSPIRFRLQDHMIQHGETLLRAGVSVIIEFGSWSRSEREAIRQIAVHTDVATELHFVDAPLPELARRVRERGGPDAQSLLEDVLLKFPEKFERPTADETAPYDAYFGPEDYPSDEITKKTDALKRGKH
jgi:predicted kinase